MSNLGMLPVLFVSSLRRYASSAISCLAVAALLLSISISHASAESSRVFRAGDGRFSQLNEYLEVLEDQAGSLSFDDVLAGRGGHFKPLKQTSKGSYTDTVYWIRLTIDYRGYDAPNSYFTKEFQHIGRLTLYYPTPKGYAASAVDETEAHAGRAINLRNFLFSVPTPVADPIATYYLKLEPRGHRAQIELAWSSSDAALEQSGSSLLWLGLVFGCLFALWCYNLFLWWFTRYRPYLHYTYYLGCFTLVMADLNGFPSQISSIGPELTKIFVLCLYGTMHGGIRFAKTLFSLRETLPGLNRYLTLCEWALLAGAIFALFAPVGPAYQVPVYLIFPCLVGAIAAGLIRWRQGFEPAAYYSIGWIVYGLTAIAFCFQIIGLLPASKVTTYVLQAGAVWEALWLSFALAYRIRLLNAEAQRSLRERQQSLLAEQAALKKAQDAMAEKNTFLSVFVNIASHELRTPMQSLVAATDLIEMSMQESGAEDANIEHAVNRIRASVSKMQVQLRDLTEYSRSSTATPTFRSEVFDLEYIARELRDTFCKSAQDSGLQFSVSVSQESSVDLVGDPLRILQVASNLVGNALKYTASGSVTVELHAPVSDDSSMHLQVRDTGIGIPPDDLLRITEPFVRGSNLPPKSQGKGLGLTVVNKLVLAMKGQLLIDSVVGHGTTISVSIPMRTHNPAMQPQVLVVDDELADEFKQILLSFGCAVVKTTDAASGIAASADTRFDLILMDIQMPGMNGCEAARKIRDSAGASRNTPIVAISAFTDSIRNADEDLFIRILEKPVDRRVLMALIGELVPGSARIGSGQRSTASTFESQVLANAP